MKDEWNELMKEMNEAKKEGDAKREFEISQRIARFCGVPEDKILKTKDDIDLYFND